MRWRLQPYVTEAATYVIKAAAKVERDRLARLYGLGGDGAQRRLGERSEERDGIEGVARAHHLVRGRGKARVRVSVKTRVRVRVAGAHHVDAWRAVVRHDRLQQLAVRTSPVRLLRGRGRLRVRVRVKLRLRLRVGVRGRGRVGVMVRVRAAYFYRRTLCPRRGSIG